MADAEWEAFRVKSVEEMRREALDDEMARGLFGGDDGGGDDGGGDGVGGVEIVGGENGDGGGGLEGVVGEEGGDLGNPRRIRWRDVWNGDDGCERGEVVEAGRSLLD